MSRRPPIPEEFLRIDDVPSFPHGQATLVRVANAQRTETYVCRIDDHGFLRTFDPYGPKYVEAQDQEVVEVLDGDG